MKKSTKSSSGVTLLEVMLVLAIAAMVIVMSIRYYQQASNSQNVNVLLNQIQNITAAADSLAQGPGGYSSLTASDLATVAGSTNMTTPYGDAIVVTFAANTVTMTIGTIPAAVCTQLNSKLITNPKYSTAGTCGTITYNSRN